ncbi:MAG: DUF5677 domain-containing protein [Bacilli bacterium]|nr:DUF5677 domain-containing protein [Bacilli bacterium]
MENEQDYQRYCALLKEMKVPEALNYDFLYRLFRFAIEGVVDLRGENPAIAQMGVNPLQLTQYLVNEHSLYLAGHPDFAKGDFGSDENYMPLIGSIAVDKYFTNEHLAYRMGTLTSRFNPSMSTIDLFLNFILGMLSRYKQGDPKTTLIVDIMNKGFQMAKCVSTLLEAGFETEAFSTWRTLHENECILQVIVKYGQPVIERYLKHIRYGIAFRGGIPTKEETDAVFVEIKDGMKAIGLKSKDMKRYIEYGWLLGVPDVMKIENFKFNFRDGVERVAGLSNYSKVYEMSSEIAHSSPLLIYSRKNFFFSVTLLNLYESFFRLESIFASLYMATVSEDEKSRYQNMRKLYFGELKFCYDFEKTRLARLNQKRPKKSEPPQEAPAEE